MSSHTDRTGEVNWPDWLQKWQSSGQPPVLRLMMPSTSISGPQCFMRTAWASSSSSGIWSSGSCEHLDQLVVRQADALVEDLDSGAFQDVRHAGQDIGRRPVRTPGRLLERQSGPVGAPP